MFDSTTAAKQLGSCSKCGGVVYENLVHHCSTAVQMSDNVQRWITPPGPSTQEFSATVHLLAALRWSDHDLAEAVNALEDLATTLRYRAELIDRLVGQLTLQPSEQ